MDAIEIKEEEHMRSYYVQTRYLKNLKDSQRKIITTPKNLLPYMKPGRLVHVRILALVVVVVVVVAAAIGEVVIEAGATYESWTSRH